MDTAKTGIRQEPDSEMQYVALKVKEKNVFGDYLHNSVSLPHS